MRDLLEYPCYETWRKEEAGRAEDAANLFGLYLMRHCRQEALKSVASAGAEARESAERAVDTALHGVMNLLEGYWLLSAGKEHRAEFVLRVNISNGREIVESQDISPSKLDLPIGYWSWQENATYS